MAFEPASDGPKVLRIWDETIRCTRDLFSENEKLRGLLTRLDEERGCLAQALLSVGGRETDLATLRKQVAEKETEAEQAAARADWLERQIDVLRKRREELEGKLESLEKESQERLRSYVELEQQNTNLANLYVASHRLHSTLDRDEVLAGIQEIIINLVGSEELAVFEVAGDGEMPRVAAAFGLPFHSFAEFPFEAQRAVIQCLETRRITIGQEDATGRVPTACIPLGVGERAVGAIAVFRFLQQKQGIESIDRDLFDLLSTHAGTALYATTLHASREPRIQ